MWGNNALMDPGLDRLEQLYHEMGPALLGYFRRQPMLASVAEDLLQDTFVRAFTRIDRLQNSVSQKAYLFGIARHVGLDALRQMKAVDKVATEAPAMTEKSDERLELMRQAISRLPETQREPLLLKLQQELSYAEIADVLDIPVGTVRSRLHHAVLFLRQTLNPS
jgi:RNA polymerase sigma-70 factor (ECF subfamily)